MSLDKALQSIVVLEVASYIPGPLCAQVLADMGAEVIKVERPGGDPLRQLDPRPPGEENPLFAAFNRGKRSIELDLKSAAGIDTLRDLTMQADVLIDGFRPRVLKRLGVGATALRALNPRLIYCGLSGYGDASEQRAQAGHDLNFLALAGLVGMSTVGGVPAMPATQLADMVSGLAAAAAVLAALQQRVVSGTGATIDMAMSDVARWLMLPALAQSQAGLPIGPERANPLGGGWACYNRYRTADGRYLALGAVEPHFWARFCAALGRDELVAAQYEPAAQEQLQATIGAIIGEATLAQWIERFAGLDACVTPVLTLDEVDALPQHRQRGYGMRFPA